MNRKNRTSASNPPDIGKPATLVTYREIAPAPELRAYVRAYFTFTRNTSPWCSRHAVTREVQFAREDSFCSPMFADGHASLVVDLGATCELGSGWRSGSPIRGRVIGALRAVGDTACVARSEMIGAYLEPGAASSLFHVPAIELTDAVVDLESLWGAASVGFAEQLAASDDPTRVGQLEAALLGHLRRASALKRTVDVVALARWARAEPGAMTVHRLANAAGVSRRHLTRVFREVVGVSPKRYCRLARFQAGLGHAGVGTGVPWTRVAADLGYVDQSHMIAEFREFSSLTPELLAVGRWFHPFILEAQARRGAGVRRAADVRRPTR